MKRFAAVAALSVGVFFLADGAHAQQTLPLSFEGRAGVAIPTGDLSDVGASSGFAFGANIAYHITPMFGVYGGYSQADFGGDIPEASFHTQGFDLGVLVDLPSPMLSPWLRGGIVFNEFRETLDRDRWTSDSQLGFEAGGGVAFPIMDMISVTPGVRFTTFPIRVDGRGDNSASYLTLDVGLRVRI